MWRHAHEDEGAKAHSLAIVNVSTKLSKYCIQSDLVCHSLVVLLLDCSKVK